MISDSDNPVYLNQRIDELKAKIEELADQWGNFIAHPTRSFTHEDMNNLSVRHANALHELLNNNK